MRTISLIFSFLGSSLLVACGSMTNKAGVENLPRDALSVKGTGLVVVSAGAPEHCIAFATFLNLQNLNTKEYMTSTPVIAVDVYVHKSDFNDHHGTVNALQLPAGRYSFTPRISNPTVRNVTAPTFEFDVAEGEVSYLGELFMTRSCGLQTSFVVRDFYNRDMKLASDRSAEVSKKVAVKRLMVAGPPSQ